MSEASAKLAGLRVKDFMSTKLETLAPDDRLLDADLVIRRAGVRHLPVVQDGRLVGLLTERDVRRYAPSILNSTPDDYNEIFQKTLVGKVMTREVTTISADAPLSEATSMLYSLHRGCLPVVDGQGALVGIITRRDILRFANQILNSEKQ